ncbi:hypothetical protein [Sphingobacterium suaedae]|uniref:DUF748 domain-containing protein n=1 Tax=Sphingobacterium suaedae TaxID=1686402 RepID=A0ABW5KPA1_9SPHI
MKAIWKWVISIIVLIIVGLVGVLWYLSHNWRPLVEEKLKEVVKSSTDSLYRLTYDDLDLSVALGNVTLENVALIPDSTVYKQMEQAKTAPDNLYRIQLKSLKIKRFGIIDILTNRKLNIKSINFESPDIQLTHKYHAYNDTLPDKPRKSLYESFKDVLTSVNVRDIQIDNIAFKYTKVEAGKSSDLALDSIQVRVHDVLIDETSLADTSRFYYTKLVEIIIPSFTYKFSDGFYMAKFDELKINTREQNILLTNVDYKPVMDRTTYFKKRGKNVTMTTLHFDTLRVEKLNFQRLLDNQQTLAERVQVKNGYVKLFGDKRYPKTPVNQIGQAPHQKLLRAKSLIKLDTVLVEGIDVVYGEMSGKYHREGAITFNKAAGILTNVTNDSIALVKNRYMKADLGAKIMDSGNLRAKFSFDMLSDNGAHSYSGSVGPMQARLFNKVLHPLLNVEIASGNIRSVRFHIEGTDYRSRGDFRFDYNNLKIDLLDEQGQKKPKRVVSFLVNQLIINDSNPDANEIYHVGKVNHKRVPEHTFFKNLWESLLDGIKQTAGISKEREARLMGTAEKAKSALEDTQGAVKKTKGFFKKLFKKDKEGQDASEQ